MIAALLNLGRPKIVLIAFQGRRYTTYMRKDAWGMWAYVYPVDKVGHVVLKDDGTIDERSESSYMRKWRKV